MLTSTFHHKFGHVELSQHAVGGHNGIDSHYAILLDDEHAYIMYDARAKNAHRFSPLLSSPSVEALELEQWANVITQAKKGKAESPFAKRQKKKRKEMSKAELEARERYESIVPR